MTQMTASQARVIDPVLSNVAQGYHHVEHVGRWLFPRVGVAQRGGTVLTFGKESFRRYSARRAPGGNTKRIDYGYSGAPFALVQDSLEGKVPFELMGDASAVPGVDLGSRAASNTMASLSLLLEIEQAELARNVASYDNDHKIDLTAAAWTDDANDPGADVEAGKEAVEATIGMEPNTLILSRAAFRAAKRNLKVREQFKYTTAQTVTLAMLKEYFEVENIAVGRSIYFDADDAAQDVWGVDAVLAYVAQSSISNEAPSYGYTYTLEGNPMVEETYQDRNAKSWIYPVTYERKPVVSGMAAGYLLKGVGTPA